MQQSSKKKKKSCANDALYSAQSSVKIQYNLSSSRIQMANLDNFSQVKLLKTAKLRQI